jgi:aminomethyltransferase
MERTVFFDIHQQYSGKMVPFAGYEMPVEFSGVKSEHICVRAGVGVFDVSHMGEIWVSGSGATDFVQKITSNDVWKLEPGKIQYSCMPTVEAGIVDDLLVYMFDEEKYLLVVNASNMEKDWNWINQNNTEGVIIENASNRTAQLAIQGPDALKVLQKLTDTDLNSIPYFSFVVETLAGKEDVLISHNGYTGAGGFEIYMENEAGPHILNEILKAGKEYNIMPVGLAARDTLRLEMGFCLYGNDIDETTSPLEAGLGWITKLTEGNDFIGKDILIKQKEEGIKRKLVGFVMQERAIPRKDYIIVDEENTNIGVATSGTMSPYTGKGIGMGYVEKQYAKEGTRIFLQIRNKSVPALIVKPPFF